MLELICEQEFLTVKTFGPLGSEVLPAFVQAMAKKAQCCGCRKFFVDHRQSQLDLNAEEIFYMPRRLAAQGVPMDQAALVFSNVGNDERFLEAALTHSGMTVKLFTDPEQARTWLSARAPAHNSRTWPANCYTGCNGSQPSSTLAGNPSSQDWQ